MEQWQRDRQSARRFCQRKQLKGSYVFQFLLWCRDWEAVEIERQVDDLGAFTLDNHTRDYIRIESVKDGHPIEI